MIIRILRSLAGLLAALAALVGIPVALWFLVGNPLPSSISIEAVRTALFTPDDGQLLIKLVTWVGWVAWLVFAVSFMVELIAQISGRSIRLPGLRIPQLAAAPLVALLLAVFVAAPTIVNATAGIAAADPVGGSGPTSSPPGSSQSVTTEHRVQASPTKNSPPEKAGKPAVHHKVERGETLWGLAKHYYGDGMKWKKLAKQLTKKLGLKEKN